jgi:hypothetical protein
MNFPIAHGRKDPESVVNLPLWAADKTGREWMSRVQRKRRRHCGCGSFQADRWRWHNGDCGGIRFNNDFVAVPQNSTCLRALNM